MIGKSCHELREESNEPMIAFHAIDQEMCIKFVRNSHVIYA